MEVFFIKKSLVIVFFVLMLALSVAVFAQEPQKRQANDAAKSTMSLPAKSTIAYKSVSGFKTAWNGPVLRLKPRTGFSRHTPMLSRASAVSKNVRSLVAVTGNAARSQLSRSSKRARFAHYNGRTAESSAVSASRSFEGSAGSGQTVGGAAGVAGGSAGSGAESSPPTSTPTQTPSSA